MRRLIALFITLMFLIGTITACGQDTNTAALELPKDAVVQTVNISSQPEQYSYSFSGDEAVAIIDYLSALNLISDFPESPDSYNGAVWIISIEYEGLDPVTVYHFGNMFIRTESGPWYKMTYTEASRFDSLLEDISK